MKRKKNKQHLIIIYSYIYSRFACRLHIRITQFFNSFQFALINKQFIMYSEYIIVL